MRCYACDCELTDFESTRKSRITDEYIDLCGDCFEEVQDVFISAEESLEEHMLEEEEHEHP